MRRRALMLMSIVVPAIGLANHGHAQDGSKPFTPQELDQMLSTMNWDELFGASNFAFTALPISSACSRRAVNRSLSSCQAIFTRQDQRTVSTSHASAGRPLSAMPTRTAIMRSALVGTRAAGAPSSSSSPPAPCWRLQSVPSHSNWSPRTIR